MLYALPVLWVTTIAPVFWKEGHFRGVQKYEFILKQSTNLSQGACGLLLIILFSMPVAFAQIKTERLVPILYYLLLEEESDRCTRTIQNGQTVTGVLSPDCTVDELTERYYTRFYTFSLAADAEVVISIQLANASDRDPHMVLREGVGPDGEELFFADVAADGKSWGIEANLESNEFTLEVSSVSQEAFDSFVLTLGQVTR